MFVEQTKGGVWQKKLLEAEDSIGMMVGYRVRIVESSGTQLGRLLPCTNPWKGQHCGQPACYTCEQGGEELQNCRQRNVFDGSIHLTVSARSWLGCWWQGWRHPM